MPVKHGHYYLCASANFLLAATKIVMSNIKASGNATPITPPTSANQANAGTLKRSLNLPLLIMYGLGTILGAGIYVLIGKVAGIAGTYAPASFLVAAIIAGFTGFSYANLSKRFPRAAGEVVYVHNALRRRWLSIMVGWLVILTGMVSCATLVNGFVGYLAVFIQWPEWLVITMTMWVIVAIACWGIAESVAIATIVTALELLGILIVITLLADAFGTLPDRYDTLFPPMQDFGAQVSIWQGIGLGAFLAFYAFIGFEDMVNVAEEVKQPQRNLPLGIMSAVVLASILYVLVAMVAVLSIPIDTLSHSDAPMVSLVTSRHSGMGELIGLISLIAILNGALVQVIMGSRIFYGMARQNMAPLMLAEIASKTQTPVKATLLLGALIWFFAIALPLVTLAKLTSFIIIIVFSLVNVSLLVIYFREYKRSADSGKIKMLVPSVAALLCAGLLILQLSHLLS